MHPSTASQSARSPNSLRALRALPALPAILALALLGACGDKDEGSKAKPATPEAPPGDAMGIRSEEARTPGTFSPKLLTSFLDWVPVLEGDVAFESEGHGGILVRSYLSPSTAEHARKASNPYPLPEGSLLAKAVVSSAGTPASKASRVYFMRKEAPGFDPENGDWSYALAKRTANGLAFDPGVSPKEDLCVSCHVNFSRFDNVKTVDSFLKGKVEAASR